MSKSWFPFIMKGTQVPFLSASSGVLFFWGFNAESTAHCWRHPRRWVLTQYLPRQLSQSFGGLSPFLQQKPERGPGERRERECRGQAGRRPPGLRRCNGSSGKWCALGLTLACQRRTHVPWSDHGNIGTDQPPRGRSRPRGAAWTHRLLKPSVRVKHLFIAHISKKEV